MGGIVQYINQRARRNRKCTPYLERTLENAVQTVYGPGYRAKIYSGGQDKKGEGTRRVGSVRHDDYGEGGRALDAIVENPEGTRLFGVELAKLGQYWLANKYGGCGLEMNAPGGGGGIHLDEWKIPPPGGGPFWPYRNSLADKPYAECIMEMLRSGHRGTKPTLYRVDPKVGSVKTISASVGRKGVNRPGDVRTVQRLINDNIIPPWGERGPLWPFERLVVDGVNGPKTMAAIEAFQTRVVAMRWPDARVDPNGRTIRLMNEVNLMCF